MFTFPFLTFMFTTFLLFFVILCGVLELLRSFILVLKPPASPLISWTVEVCFSVCLFSLLSGLLDIDWSSLEKEFTNFKCSTAPLHNNRSRTKTKMHKTNIEFVSLTTHTRCPYRSDLRYMSAICYQCTFFESYRNRPSHIHGRCLQQHVGQLFRQ